jgi:AcrR family transcriptional regulator
MDARLADEERRPSAPIRILQATADRIVSDGATNLSMQDVANAAGVSKGLIHYHFTDKETLLSLLVEWIARESVVREYAALASSTAKTALDDVWYWVSTELERGHLRVLTELSHERGQRVREASRLAAEARREAAASTVARLWDLLELRPRVPFAMLADVVVAFLDGLAVRATIAPRSNHRVLFDVFWLSLLSLAE